MRNLRSLSVRNIVTAAMLAVPMLMIGGTAHAQTASPAPPASFDFSGLATSGKTELNGALGSFMPVVIGIFITLLGIGLVWMWTKKSVKSA